MADAGDVIQASVKMLLAGQQVYNVYQLSSPDPTSDAALIPDIVEIIDGLYLFVDNYMSDDLSAVSISLKNISQGYDMGEYDFIDFTGGLSTDDPLPNGVAGLITLPTSRLKTRGRKFLPGIIETETTASVFTSNVLTAMGNMAIFLSNPQIGTLTDAEILFGVIDSLSVFREFVSSIVSNIPAYQRRRKQGVGI